MFKIYISQGLIKRTKVLNIIKVKEDTFIINIGIEITIT